MLVSLCMSKMRTSHPILAEINALWFLKVMPLAVIEAVNCRNEVWIWYGQLIEDLRSVQRKNRLEITA